MKNHLIKVLLIIMTYSNLYSVTEIENKATLPVLTPSLANQKQLKVRLENGLEAVLISDPTIDKSGAVLSVQVGSWEDPEEHPGIAHFLEHMLFMGTKKYPEEGGYHRYIQDHGGTTNAFTANHVTSYIFSIDNNYIEEALDRFSYFFKEPLFNPSGVNRELHAIDQEYEMNVQKDSIREYFVYKALANPKHPHFRFNIGSSETLKNVSQQELISWYKEHYSANLMRLLVISHLPLDELKELVIKDFSGIPNYNKEKFLTELPYTQDSLKGKMIVIEPLKDKKSISLVWELPTEFVKMQKEKPAHLIAQILGHEGNESLLAELKRKNLATGISSGSSESGAINGDFIIEIALTDKGFEQVNEVIALTFQAINNFKEKGLPKELFDEIQSIEKLKYQYQPREEVFSFLMGHGMTISDEDITTYPEATKITQKYDPKTVKRLLDYLTPQNALYFLSAPKNSMPYAPELMEKWLKVNYSIKEIDPELLENWALLKKHPNIDLPIPNPFIPSSLEVKLSEEDLKNIYTLLPRPTLIEETEHSKFYFCKDNKFKEPKSFWYVEIKTPKISATDPLKLVMADIYTKLLNHSLKRLSYPAEVAGLQYVIRPENNGLSLTVAGFSDKSHVLLDTILKAIKNEELDYANFNAIKQDLLKKYQNAIKESPLTIASEYFKETIIKSYVNEKEKAIAIKKINLKAFQTYVKELFKENYLQGLFYGNNSEKDIHSVIAKVTEAFPKQNYPLERQLKKEIINLPKDEGPFYIEASTEMQGNAIILAIESTPYTLDKRIVQDIASQAMKEPFFSELRTKQQTGYITTNYGLDLEQHLFEIFAVQSVTHDPRDLLARFELFIEGFLQELENKSLPEERFDTIKSTLIKTLETPAKSIIEMGGILTTLAFERNGDFDWLSRRIEAMKNLSYPEFVVEVKQMLGRKNSQRVAVLIKGVSPDNKTFQYHPTKVKELKKMSTFSSKS